MESPFIKLEGDDFILYSFDIEPIDGYQKPINKDTGEEFPFCCSFHKRVFESTKEMVERFQKDKENAKKWWFNKIIYNDIALKVVNQLSYTEYLISKKIAEADWFKHITDYIEFNVLSFGKPAIGANFYMHNLKHYITINQNEIPNEKKQKLIENIENYHKIVKSPQTDLNILYATYQKWLKIFPFEISYFSNLKQHFEKNLPFFIDKYPEVNIYSGMAKTKIHTKNSLVEVLIDLTNDLLTKVNGLTLYEKGFITDPNKVKLEIILSRRRLKLKQGYKNNSPNEEQRYRRILKEWLKDEKEFIDEISPYIKNVPIVNSQNDELKVNQIALIHVYEGWQINRENANEIAAKFGYTSKNSGEGLFQDYTKYCSRANRMGKPSPCTPKTLSNKINLFESISEHLSNEAGKKLKDEINALKVIYNNEYQ